MANEYLKRTPTSSGNQKVWTLSTWIKQIDTTGASGNGSFLFGYFDEGASPTPRGSIQINESATSGKHSIGWNQTGSSWYQTTPEGRYRDNQNWYHLLVAIDTTKSSESDGVQMYINGVKRGSESYLGTWGSGAAALNIDTGFNSLVEHYIGAFAESVSQSKLQYSDFFYIDGQQLGPEIFGFYKDGNGYISAGSTQSTDFRNGQWVPRTPREIKNLINDNGGFGVNGFYLPMNDSSNFGADFHTTPNSIIKLKGEDLPQPRNGAPTTTDAYVSQLREDPYAANLVLAVPGISTSTSANLITNGTFDTNTTGWTVINSSAALSVDSQGRLQVNRTGSNLNAYQYITTEIGKRYTLSANLWSGTGGNFIIRAYQSNLTTSYGTTSGSTGDIKNLSFTALETTSSIILSVDNSGTAFVDNIVVRQEDAPRDYSADIKGSGTNKTVQATLGTGGVGYDIPSYYGSAINANDNNCGYAFSGADSAFVCPGDFTVEFWLDPVVATQPTGNPRILGQTNNSGGKWDIYIDSTTSTNRIYTMGGSVALTGGNGSSYGNFVPGQWNHFCLERSGSTMTTYMNGVAVYTQTYTNTIGTTDFLYLGSYGDQSAAPGYGITGKIQDFRFYKGVAKYKGGFDVPKPYTPVGIATWRAVPDCTANNFATLNPLIGNYTDSNFFASDGNLSLNVLNNSGYRNYSSNFSPENSKGYLELRWSTGTPNGQIGITDVTKQDTNLQYTSAGTFFITQDGNVRNGPTTVKSGYTPSFSSGDILQIAFDFTGTNKNIWFGRNGTWGDNTVGTGNPSSGTNPMFTSTELTGDYRFYFGINTGAGTQVVNCNFGQNPTFSGNTTAGTFADDSGKGLFKYQPPTGFLALCEDNLPTPAIPNPGKHFKTVLYTGSGGSKAITGVGFQPDFIWVKSRTNTEGHIIFDSVRGANERLLAMGTQAEATATGGVNSFDEDGYSTGVYTGTNQSGQDYVAWCWKAGGAAVSNTDGSITSQVSVNQDAGFSIVSWTGNATGGATVGHGLDKSPDFTIVKSRTNSTRPWAVESSVFTGRMLLNTTDAVAQFSHLKPYTDTVLTLEVGTTSNESGGKYIAYCWAEIEGYSKFGSYVGNGSTDGPFVYCGFKPAWVMVKSSSTVSNWLIMDNARNSTNPVDLDLYANLTNIESQYDRFDYISNGFKVRNTSGEMNTSGATYIFAAFAESPFQTANAK